MKKIAVIVGIVGSIVLTSIYAIGQRESANQKLGVSGAAPESDKNTGPAGTSDATANQKLGAPGAAPESDKNIGPAGTRDSTIGSDKKPTNRSSALSKGNKQSSGSPKSKGQAPTQ